MYFGLFFLSRFAFLSRFCYISVMKRNITLYFNLMKNLIVFMLIILTICSFTNNFSFSNIGLEEFFYVSLKDVVYDYKLLVYSFLLVAYTSCLVRLCLLYRVILKRRGLHILPSLVIPYVGLDIGENRNQST